MLPFRLSPLEVLAEGLEVVPLPLELRWRVHLRRHHLKPTTTKRWLGIIQQYSKEYSTPAWRWRDREEHHLSSHPCPSALFIRRWKRVKIKCGWLWLWSRLRYWIWSNVSSWIFNIQTWTILPFRLSLSLSTAHSIPAPSLSAPTRVLSFLCSLFKHRNHHA